MPLRGHLEGSDFRKPFQKTVHAFPQVAGSLTMNDAHLFDAKLHAGIQVIGYQRLDFIGTKGMKIKLPIDG